MVIRALKARASWVSDYGSLIGFLKLRRLSAMCVGLLAAAGFGEALTLFALSRFLKSVQYGASFRQTVVVVSAFLALGTLSTLSQFYFELLAHRLRGEAERRLRRHTNVAVLAFDWVHFHKLRLGDLSKAILTEGNHIALGIVLLLEGAACVIVALGFVCLSMFISSKMTLLTMLFLVPIGLVYVLVNRRARHLSEGLSDIATEVGIKMNDVYGSLKFVRSSGLTDKSLEAMDQVADRYATNFIEALFRGSFVRSFLQLASVFYVAGVLCVGPWILNIGLIEVLIFLTIFYRLIPRLNRAQDCVFHARNYLGWYRTWKDRLEFLTQHPLTPSGKIPSSFRSTIRFDAVDVLYPGNAKPVLRNVTATIRKGQLIGIVGPSGVGKTTMLDVLTGLISPSTGRVLVDDVMLKDVDLEAWRQSIAVMTQEPCLFYGDIVGNISWFSDAPDLERVRMVLRQADAEEFVNHLPHGMRTSLGDKGINLSVGQRQRLALARALYRQPLLLLLDEPTSALDVESQAAILRTLESLRGRITMVMVTHQRENVRTADLVIDLGREADDEGVSPRTP